MLLFLVACSRRDCKTTVAFLTTHVSCLDEDGSGKLRRVLCYLKRNPTLGLTLKANNLILIHWNADNSFALHQDFKSHTRASMIWRKGSIMNTSHKQKIHTRSSMEVEMFGADNAVTRMQWT